MNDAERHVVEPVRAATSDGAILFDRACIAQADGAWLDPAHWRGSQAQDGRGGRGAVWRVEGSFGAGVLRHYRRGGFVARLNRDRYLWRGEEATRSFREFRLLAELRRRGLNVPQPLVAGYARQGAFYRADLLTALIGSAQTLAEQVAEGLPEVAAWQRLGMTLAHFHAEGVYHADLNAHNIMLDAEGAIWLIDFDRGELRGAAAGWKRANLDRLQRSLRKLGAARQAGWSEAWQALRSSYRAAGEGDA
jgi:3-deoxy-D-manno-octulosonic acid kinase